MDNRAEAWTKHPCGLTIHQVNMPRGSKRAPWLTVLLVLVAWLAVWGAVDVAVRIAEAVTW